MYSNIIWKAEDGKEITLYFWEKTAIPKGIVQIVHGMNEHMLRYNDFAEYLNQNGYMVIGDDHRSHGLTAGSREKIGMPEENGDLYEKTLTDVVAITEYLGFTYNLPIFIVGHSYGSMLLQSYMMHKVFNPKVKGLVFSGTAIIEGMQLALGKVAAALGGKNKPANFIYNQTFKKYDNKFKEGKSAWLTRDKKIVDLYNADQLIVPVFTNGFYRSFFKGVSKIWKKPNNAKYISKMPILISGGSRDAFSDNGTLASGFTLKLKKEGFTNVDFKLYKDARHEVLNETNKRQIYKDMLTFFDKYAVKIKE